MSNDLLRVGDRVVVGMVLDPDILDEVVTGLAASLGARRVAEGPVRPIVATVRDCGLTAIEGIAVTESVITRETKGGALVTATGARFKITPSCYAHSGPGDHSRYLVIDHAREGSVLIRANLSTDKASRIVVADALEAAGDAAAADRMRAPAQVR